MVNADSWLLKSGDYFHACLRQSVKKKIEFCMHTTFLMIKGRFSVAKDLHVIPGGSGYRK